MVMNVVECRCIGSILLVLSGSADEKARLKFHLPRKGHARVGVRKREEGRRQKGGFHVDDVISCQDSDLLVTLLTSSFHSFSSCLHFRPVSGNSNRIKSLHRRYLSRASVPPSSEIQHLQIGVQLSINFGPKKIKENLFRRCQSRRKKLFFF